MNLKDRLISYLTQEEIHKLECAADNEKEIEKQKHQTYSSFKLPIFQPTAAAAMMYNMQSATIKQKRISDTEKEARIQSNDANHHSNNKQLEVETLAQRSQDFLTPPNVVNQGAVSPSLIGRILKKEGDSKPKLFPFICHKCKKDIWSCDTASQTVEVLSNENLNDVIIYPNNNYNENITRTSSQIAHNRSKSNANDLNNRNFLLMQATTSVFDVNECDKSYQAKTNNSFITRKQLDSWTDLDVNYK